MIKGFIRFMLCCTLTAASTGAFAQSIPADKTAEIEAKIDALARELEKLKLGEASEWLPAVAPAGQAPAATKVYRSHTNHVSLGGYGEMSYQNFDRKRQNGSSATSRDELDFVRAVLYFGYKFNDWILFNSETEFEHGSTGKTRGEVSIEQAYLDFKFHDLLGARAGLLLVPMGFINEVHEPTTYHGVRRPNVEQRIIPTTWRENGAGLFGAWGPLAYRSYLLSGLQAVSNTGVTGFSSSNGWRDGRSSGAKSYAEDLAWAARLDYSPVAGLRAGVSYYMGQADQRLVGFNVPVSLWEAHAGGEYKGAELRVLYAQGAVGNTDSLNAAQGITAASGSSIGSRLFGGYVEGAFNVLSLAPNTSHYLAPFVRWERYDTQLDTPQAFAKNPANSRVEYTVGLTYKPIPQAAVKTDYQWMRNQAKTGTNQFNLGIGYIF